MRVSACRQSRRFPATPPGTPSRLAMARGCWPLAEVNNGRLLSGTTPDLFGDLGLTGKEEAALVAFMRTMTDKETVDDPRCSSTVCAK
jgi:cytochrome c peroxidase